jgi:hypothetical protein
MRRTVRKLVVVFAITIMCAVILPEFGVITIEGAKAQDTPKTSWIKVDEAQSTPTTAWNRTYGGANDDWGLCAVEAGDGGFAIAGITCSIGARNEDFWLVRTDAFGNMLWNKTYGGTGGDYAYSVVVTGDGGYAIAGTTKSFGAGSGDFWLVKLQVEYPLGYTNSAVSLSVRVEGDSPTGQISWTSNSTTGTFYSSTTLLSGGISKTTYIDSAPGAVNIAATYSGDQNNLPSSDSIIIEILSSKNWTLQSDGYRWTQKGFPLAASVQLDVGVNTVEVYANSTLVFECTTTVIDNPLFLPIQFDTYGLAVGNYTLTANVNGDVVVLEEYGVSYLGDLNGDFKINYLDIALFVDFFIDYQSIGTVNILADFNLDGKINYIDINRFVDGFIEYYTPK